MGVDTFRGSRLQDLGSGGVVLTYWPPAQPGGRRFEQNSAFFPGVLLERDSDRQCSVGCSSCSGSTCLKCESSYFLSSSSCSPCPGQCTSCTVYNNCTSCKPNKWGSGSQCQYTCVDSCYNKECQYDTGYCVQCKPGLYGLQCQHNCSDCEGDLCDLRRCTRGCKQGYYEYNTEYESICQTCPTDCRNCYDARTCRACNDGFHLYQFHLKENVFVHCISCSLGSGCSNYCIIQNCNKCEVHDGSLVCTDCSEGYRFNGKTCILNTTSCSQECSSHCDDDGICLGSCKAGWTGERCSGKCSDKCFTCNKNNSNICQQCKGDFYTAGCNVACKTSCIKIEGKQTCKPNNGYCLNGCEHNFWGPVCGQSCSSGCVNNSLSPICERNNGTCKHGCKDGYNGEKCDTTITSRTTLKPEDTSQFTPTSSVKETTLESNDGKSESQKDSKDMIIIGSAAGGGVLVLILIIVIIVCLVKRR
ncbi:multiple epidermal growth factor-like domains protein 10 [Mercenaria mercenaria]|uniref:multiple epidermal growth factor-like domains protein 10 n=1 Tax=Mercenaria mercenaria TaxID=6596 RepID=UPI00234EBA69|nr:multiple epidermal growth factor-like domains protein 10 [Mercenaria mercenaria]